MDLKIASPSGGSTLITVAPKSPSIVAAIGAAMKLAQSITLNPEKRLCVSIEHLTISAQD
jgi:hypothetical protein